MEVILILITVISILIPTIATIEWVKYNKELDMEFMSDLKSMTMEEEPVSVPAIEVPVRRYNHNYITKLESEADKRMRQANSFYEKGVCW